MPAVLPMRPRRALQRALLGLLLLGLLLQAQAGVLRQLLGAAHWHRPAAALAAPAADGLDGWLLRLQTWRHERLARSPLVGGHGQSVRHAGADAHLHGHPHAHAEAHTRGPAPAPDHAGHHHDRPDRHHHAPQDGSVVALEAGDGDGRVDAGAGSLLQPLALAPGLRWPATTTAEADWPGRSAPRWQDARQRQPERPPRA